MEKRSALVLAGGGSRGALQVGAARALLEAGYTPQFMVGTSIGACNAAFLGIYGFNQDSLHLLEQVWLDTVHADLLPSNYLWLTVRTLFNRRLPGSSNHLREFFVSHGLKPELRFKDLAIPVHLVATDLNSGQMLVFGDDPEGSVLEGVLASTALPPWVSPLALQGRLLMDGGVVSNLPLQAALQAGASEVIALDLSELFDDIREQEGFGPFATKLMRTVVRRQAELELNLLAAKNIPVLYIHLIERGVVQLYDFTQAPELISQGYEQTHQAYAQWLKSRPTAGLRARLAHWLLKARWRKP